jgi:hypothetical protein
MDLFLRAAKSTDTGPKRAGIIGASSCYLLLRHLSLKIPTQFQCKQGDGSADRPPCAGIPKPPYPGPAAAPMPKPVRYLRLTVRDNMFIEVCVEQLEELEPLKHPGAPGGPASLDTAGPSRPPLFPDI